MNVSPNDRGIEHHPLQIGVLQCVEDLLPNPFLGPAIEPLKDTVPVAESFRQVAPRCSRASDPQHRLHEQSIVVAAAPRTPRPTRQQSFHSLPLLVRQLKPPPDIPPP